MPSGVSSVRIASVSDSADQLRSDREALLSASDCRGFLSSLDCRGLLSSLDCRGLLSSLTEIQTTNSSPGSIPAGTRTGNSPYSVSRSNSSPSAHWSGHITSSSTVSFSSALVWSLCPCSGSGLGSSTAKVCPDWIPSGTTYSPKTTTLVSSQTVQHSNTKLINSTGLRYKT